MKSSSYLDIFVPEFVDENGNRIKWIVWSCIFARHFSFKIQIFDFKKMFESNTRFGWTWVWFEEAIESQSFKFKYNFIFKTVLKNDVKIVLKKCQHNNETLGLLLVEKLFSFPPPIKFRPANTARCQPASTTTLHWITEDIFPLSFLSAKDKF